MARDEFTQKVIEKIKGRVGGRCSKTDCRVPTTGPSMADSEKVSSIGVAAHICAASPGGPRYDDIMTPRQRRSVGNGIWLCATHATEIDRDVVT